MATKRNNREPNKEELTTEMHYEFVGDHDEVSEFDFRVYACSGAIARGLSKMKALRKYNLTEEEYDKNIDRVLHDPSW